MTTDAEIRAAVAKLRAVAETVGPLHGYWDIIFDAEELLAGRATMLPRDQVLALLEETAGPLIERQEANRKAVHDAAERRRDRIRALLEEAELALHSRRYVENDEYDRLLARMREAIDPLIEAVRLLDPSEPMIIHPGAGEPGRDAELTGAKGGDDG